VPSATMLSVRQGEHERLPPHSARSVSGTRLERVSALSDLASKPACKATNRAGGPCGNKTVLPSGYCIVHDADSEIAKRFQAGPLHTPGPGREKKPGAHQVLCELVERQVERILAPFVAALESDDLDVAMRGGRELMDRAWGKPKQAVDVDHTSGGKTLDQLFAPTPLAQTNTLLPAGDEPAAWEGTE
jgi:hypothetical protein